MVRALFSSVYATMVGENYFQIYSFQIAGKYICEPPYPPPPPHPSLVYLIIGFPCRTNSSRKFPQQILSPNVKQFLDKGPLHTVGGGTLYQWN